MAQRGVTARIAGVLGLPFATYATLSTAYLLTLTAAAWRADRTPPAAPDGTPLFDLVIAAHDEETTLPHLLASIAALDYPADRRRIHVVADNCRDRTAEVARRAGALVQERRDDERIGKGYALAMGIAAALALPGRPDDAIVILDADSEVSPNFLRALAAHLGSGAGAIQAYYSVSNAADSGVAMLRYAALCLYHYVRPLGRSHLGLSAGLRGNGMCFRRDVAGLGWSAHGLAEDVEQHVRLLERGIHTVFAPAAVVRAEMPVTFSGAAAQNRRWERGRLEVLAAELPRLLRMAIGRRDLSALDAAVEQAVAPLSVCLLACCLAAMSGLVSGSRLVAAAGLAGLAGQGAYVLLGLRLVGAPAATYRALAAAPRYVLWKGWVWLRASARRPARWQRTARRGDPAGRLGGEWSAVLS